VFIPKKEFSLIPMGQDIPKVAEARRVDILVRQMLVEFIQLFGMSRPAGGSRGVYEDPIYPICV
jgi:hypothetical protein